MKRLWTSVPLALAFAGVVTVAAQSTGTQTTQPGTQTAQPATQTPPAATQTPPAPRPATATSPTSTSAITVNGCLEGSGSMTANTGASGATTGTSGTANQWVLANASIGPAAAATAGTSGTSGGGAPGTTPEMQQAPSAPATRTASAATARYTLEGRAEDLVKHRGHRIEVTGTMMPATGTSPQMQQAGSSTDQRLQVTSIKMISATCP